MRPLILLVALAVGACNVTTAPEPPAPTIEGDIIGHWTGQRAENRADVLWLSHVEADGTLEIEFWTCFNGQRMRWQRQSGLGGLRDGLFETRIARQEFRGPDDDVVNVNEEGFDYDYRVTELTDSLLRYESEELDERYEVTRVDASYTLRCPPATVIVDTEPTGPRQPDAWIRRGVEDGQSDE
ncbi:MAG: hypothetical protein AB8G17_07650 [Gammaproteobacteria bacterium]